ncbi:TetR/AcrR family transcriptional regulator [Streptomyces hyaluromycini]|uniref:TetR/AcrR family transcriptional regulator n=1 Tax=Streptomyces hyaluromycini TaxID=1377993 RepID=UPI001C3F8D18|nr:TetR/AcrR family transcriptional regulator [Streptomyces hyaluromycini]
MPPSATADETPLRRKLMDAALELFDERTWDGTNVPEIAARAGVAVGTIYRYFPNKQALGEAVFTEAKAAFADAVVTDAVRAADPVTAIGLVWHHQVAFALAYPQAFSFLEHQVHGSYLRPQAYEVVHRLDAELVEILRAAQAAGAVRAGDPQVLLSMAFGAFVGVTKHSRASGVPLGEYDLEGVREAVMSLIGLTGPDSPDAG